MFTRFSELNAHCIDFVNRIAWDPMRIEPIHSTMWFGSETKVDRQINVWANPEVKRQFKDGW